MEEGGDGGQSAAIQRHMTGSTDKESQRSLLLERKGKEGVRRRMERVGLMDRRDGDSSGAYTKSQRNNGVMMGKVWDHRGFGGQWMVVSLW
jgi:hypothetical protein